MELLLESEANVNASIKQSDRDTVLYASASTGNINPVKLLLGQGAVVSPFVLWSAGNLEIRDSWVAQGKRRK